MKSIKILLAMIFALAFSGCEITVTEDISSYEDNYYSTGYYHYTRDCDVYSLIGDATAVDYSSCSSWYSTSSIAFDFDPYTVTVDDGYETSYSVYDVYAFEYAGDTYIAYDIGGGDTYEYNYSADEVGYYSDYIVDYYSN